MPAIVLSKGEVEALRRLAQSLGLTPGETIRYLIRTTPYSEVECEGRTPAKEVGADDN